MADKENNHEADEVAKKLIEMLVGAFKTRENRDPTPEEVEELMSELTEERITALLTGEEEAGGSVLVEGETEEERVDAVDGEQDDDAKKTEVESKENVSTADKENVEDDKKKEGSDNKAKVVEDSKTTAGKRKEVETEDKATEGKAFKWPKVAA